MNAPRTPRRDFETALAEYFDDLEAGRPPHREEFLARYPHCAAELRKFFDDLSFVDAALGASTKFAPNESTAADLSVGPDDSGWDEGGNASALGATIAWLGGFRIHEELGSGGQGVVYKARQTGTNRLVALKVLREGLFASKRDRQRFHTEVELASRLQHPNIVTIYECRRESGRDFYAMEYVDGDPLDVHLSNHSLDLPATLRLFLEIGNAVSYAHQHGVIHRDLKPSNVMVDRSGTVRVLDFGLAKAVATDASTVAAGVTRAGDFAGTWHYASPEQVARDPHRVDVRTDVYSLGVLLYEMLTDCLPYPVRDESREAIARHILETPPPRPSTIRREIEDDLDTIVLTALQKESDRRYASAAALVEDVRRYLAGEAIEAKRDSSWYVLRKTIRRYRWRFTAAAVSLAALLVFAVTISILYSYALSAQATTELRTRIVRESQNYLADKLGELNWASNRLAEIAAAHPDLPEVQALNEEPLRDLRPILDLLKDEPPPDVLNAMIESNSPTHAAAHQWLTDHEQDLAEVEELLLSKRLDFGIDTSTESDLAIDFHPRFVGEAQRIVEVLAARALLNARASDPHAAINSLDAARTIAISLGDGHMLHHKALSVAARSRTYDALSAILAECTLEASVLDAYDAWIKRDPPLPAYRLALAMERQRVSQLIEGASFTERSSGLGSIDTKYLADMVGGFSQSSSESTRAFFDAQQRVSPEDALALVDTYLSEVEQWDGLNFPSLVQRSIALQDQLKEYAAWPVVKMILPGCKTGFELRGRTETKRASQFLVAGVLQHYCATGHWPDTILAAVSDTSRESINDPYVGHPFGYQVKQGRPMLYSLNEDRKDNDGIPGSWGLTGTDVILFQRRSPLHAPVPNVGPPHP